MLTPGQTHDVLGFVPLFRMIADRIEALLADKGYDVRAPGDRDQAFRLIATSHSD